MENLISRHRNVSILVAILFAQVLGLAVQVKRSSSGEETRLIRIWAVELVTPFEKALVWMQQTSGGLWRNYIYLRGARAENRELKQQIEQMRLEEVRLSEDAEQAHRLQVLLGFKEKFVAKTVAAQVIGTSGSEQSRSVYIDKGFADGIKADQPVMTADGIVGKVLHVYDHHTSNVLLVSDQTSGVGVILNKSRLQGILRGTAAGELMVEKIMNDESIEPGERVLTSGGDQIFPKGFDVGTVIKVSPGKDSFLNIRVRPAANLSKLEEVLVITQVDTKSPSAGQMAGSVRAVDILAQRLPSVPNKPPADQAKPSADATKPPATMPQAATPGLASRGSELIRTVPPPTSAVTKPDSAGSASTKAAGGWPATTVKKEPAGAASTKAQPAGAGTAKPSAVESNSSASQVVPDKAKPAQRPTATEPLDKSARPAPSPSKPEPAPVEDTPQ